MPKTKDSKHKLSAISASFLENSSFLKKFLTRFFSTQQDIEDVVQEVYLRAYVTEQKNVIDQPKAFLFRVAKNVAFTKLTNKSRQITDYLEDFALSEVLDREASSDDYIEAEEMLGIYCEAVASLSDKCREVFLLRKVHGLSHKEIAKRMSLSASSVDKYLRQGILTCKAFVREKETPATGQKTAAKLPLIEKTLK